MLEVYAEKQTASEILIIVITEEILSQIQQTPTLPV